MKYPQNITEIESLKPDLMGFIFYKKSKRFFNQPEINLNGKIKKVGVFVNENFQEIKNKIKKYKLDYVQLHGEETVSFCNSLNHLVKIIKVFKIDDNFNFKKTEEFKNVCDFFLFDTKTELNGGSGIKFNWDVLQNYKCKIPVQGGWLKYKYKYLKNSQIHKLILKYSEYKIPVQGGCLPQQETPIQGAGDVLAFKPGGR